MSDTNNNEVTPAVTTEAVQPIPAVTPTVAPVQTVAPAVSSVPVTPAQPVAAAPVTPVPEQPQPPVAISVPATPAAPAPEVAAPAAPAEATAPVAETKPAENVVAKEEIGSEENLFSGPVESKSTDSISSDLAVPDDPNSSSSKKESSGQSSNGEDFVEEKENKKLPIAVLIIFVLLLIIVVIYYFIVMTPTKVFDKAIDNIFDSVTGVVDSIQNNKSDTMKFKIGVKMETDGDINKYLDGVKFDAEIGANLKDLELGLRIETDAGDTDLTEEDKFDSTVFVKDGGVYVTNDVLEKTYPGNVALYTDSEFTDVSYDRVDDIIEIVERTKNEIIDIIKDEQLRRTIAIKKINNQTTIALKASCTLDNKGVADIYKPIFEEYLNDEEFIKKIASAIGSVTEQEVKDEIKRLYERDVVTQNIDVNLYMNLANTQLISLDVTVDDYFVEIDNLNGYFFGVVKYKGVKDSFDAPEFIISFEYDANKGLLNGYGQIDKPGQDFIYSLFDYTRSVDESGKKVGNSLHINFFNKVVRTEAEQANKKNIIARLDCTLDIDDDNPKLTLRGKKEAIEKTEEIEEGINVSMNRLTHYVNYVFRTLLYSKWEDEKYASEMRKRAIEKKIEKQNKNGEDYLDVSDIKAEVEEAKNYCSKTGTYAYLLNGGSKTTGQFDGFPDMEDSVFDWICLFGQLDEDEEKKLSFDAPDSLNYSEIEKIINDKLAELKVTPTKKTVEVESVTVTPTSKDLKVGDTYKILSAYEPSNATKTKMTWKSSNTKVATVDSAGNVKAIAAGNAKITVKSESGKEASTTIKVVAEETTNSTSEE